MPAPVLEAIDSFDRALRNGDVAVRTQLLAAYRRGWMPILAEMERLRERIATAPRIAIIRGDGTPGTGIPPSWLFQEARYQALQSDVRGLVHGMAAELGEATLAGQAGAWDTGVAEAARAGRNLAEIDPRSWGSAPRSAFQAFTAGAQGGPLRTLLAGFETAQAPQAAGYARDVLGAGLLAGRSALQVARDLETGLQTITFGRAYRIARTELLRAYREGARRSYMQNPAIVQSWAWRAAVENRERPPCAACFAKHGSLHPISESMQTHPNCRCRMVPRRSPLFGVMPNDPILLDREQAFTALPLRTQRSILGPTRLAGWQRGTWKLEDFATTRARGPWGANAATVRPLYELRNLSAQPGRALNFAADRLFMQAANAERGISATLQDVAVRTDGRLEGYAFRLKLTPRIAEKIQTDVFDGRGGITAVSQGINDALRYTLRFSPEQYASGVRVALDELQSRGAQILRTKNYWNAPAGYRGFHAVLQDRTGARYELQFHTAESLAVKEKSHTLYEIQRQDSTSPAKRRSLQAEIDALWRVVSFPPTVKALG